MKQKLLLLTSFIFMITNLWANNHEGKEQCEKCGKKQEHFFSEVLGLDKKKIQEIKELLDEKKKEQKQLWLEIKKEKISLKQEVIDGMDLKNIRSILEEISKIKVEISFMDFETDVEIREKLNKEQWNKYLMHKKKKREKMHEKHHNGACHKKHGKEKWYKFW